MRGSTLDWTIAQPVHLTDGEEDESYGELWVRPGLDRRERLLCALASFTVLGLDSQVRKFGVSALSAGLSEEQVIAVLVQTAPYGGFPRALNALATFGDAISD